MPKAAGTPSDKPATTAKSLAEKHAGVAEKLLLDAVLRLVAAKEKYRAVHIHLARLRDNQRKSDYLRIASDLFELRMSPHAGRLFVLGNGDLFFLVKNTRKELVVSAVERLRLLFAEDPVAHYAETPAEDRFATYYNFATDINRLLEDVGAIARNALAVINGEIPQKTPSRAFMPADLARLVTLLDGADLTNIVRYQTTCSMGDDGLPTPLFEEHFVSISDLRQACAPEIDLLADPWLFQYLTRTLDKRMLGYLSQHAARNERARGPQGAEQKTLPFSVNLTLATVLSPEFRTFDERLPEGVRGQVTVEVQASDMFGDISAYMFARDYLRTRQYRICLDGLTHHTLPLFDFGRLGVDYAKIHWGSQGRPDGLNAAHPSSHREIAALIARIGAKHAILCRCEDEAALVTGRKLGFRLFQGRYIERLVTLVRDGKKKKKS